MMKKLVTWNYAAIISFTIMSLSVLFTPLSPAYDPIYGKKAFSYLIFVLFWAGLLAGVISTVMASATRKRLKQKLRRKNNLPGAFVFFRNAESTATMAIFLLGIIATFVFRILHVSVMLPLQFFCLFCILWGFSMHSIFDGINYRTAKRFDRVQAKEETTK